VQHKHELVVHADRLVDLLDALAAALRVLGGIREVFPEFTEQPATASEAPPPVDPPSGPAAPAPAPDDETARRLHSEREENAYRAHTKALAECGTKRKRLGLI
jgi:hypothetical protein